MLIEEKMSRNLNGIDNDGSSDIEAIFLNWHTLDDIWNNDGFNMEAGQETIFLVMNSRSRRNIGFEYKADCQYAAPAFEITEVDPADHI